MSPTYAKGTDVPVRNTRMEIERLLEKWNASRIGVVLEPGRAIVGFTIEQWSVRFTMPLPTPEEAAKKAPRRYSWSAPTEEQKRKWLEQRTREKWRALGLTIKAKLVSVENGVETFEQAFLAHLVLGGGETAGERLIPQLIAGNGTLALPPASAP